MTAITPLVARVEDHVYVLLVHDTDAARWDAIKTLDRWGCDPELNLNAGEVNLMANAIWPQTTVYCHPLWPQPSRFQLPEMGGSP